MFCYKDTEKSSRKCKCMIIVQLQYVKSTEIFLQKYIILNGIWYYSTFDFIHIQYFTSLLMALSMQIIPGRQIYWTWGFTHHGLCLTSGCIQVSPGSGGGCVPTDVLQSAATFLPRSPHSGGLGSMISRHRHRHQLQVQVGFNLWWQQLYWAMNSPAPTHLLLHRGTSGHLINHLFVIYLVIWNLLFRIMLKLT